jgi:hypothetical protein
MPWIVKLHELIKDLERKSSVVGDMGLGTLSDSNLKGDLGVFANRDQEKGLVLVAVERLVTGGLLSPSDVESMMRRLLDETKFYGAFSELATYGWLLRHSLGRASV